MDFIEVYEGVLSAEACRALIDRFEASGQAQRGSTAGGVDLALKDGWDIQLDDSPGWADACQQLNSAVQSGLAAYLRRYAHAALAPLQLKMRQPPASWSVSTPSTSPR
ncbi:hypothetical protein [Roseateles violae]|uniref:Uncharacterized protein n=1 Tax=Roseateles violae TaxID=3058042 RepID=A0ABT8DS56_9BURK|nr:hypothetical protein [Pelomonas sp. PFR6]MDN3921159.1 hypothetical protein [Pelomonas sp. PFR6]